ncbi:MAG: ThuA domain-containing protein [Maribacter sp.]|nr:ThuA domain-containing protein [Maribacter sp.]
MQRFLLPIFAFIFIGGAFAQDAAAFPLTDEWLGKIEKLAPDTTTVHMERKKNILIFSLFTGFEHWTIPHTEAVIKCIAEKSKGFTVTTSTDIAQFEKDHLKNYDAIVLNNNCSIGDKRNLFWDVLKTDTSLTDAQRWSRAHQLETNLLQYVKNGGGLMVLHGGIVMQNNSEKFGEMLGGSFDYHPKQQKIKVKLAAADHPLVQAFQGKEFEHIDEPYFFNNAYFDYNFRPLLYMDADKLVGKKEEVKDTVKYISWIKRYGQGRVFYCSPSHNAQSMENPQMLQFLLDGLQYVTGDLECDDSPIGK